ncbi:MAG: ABC transporter permease [Candidatus Methanoplasma sp.]|jgi:ABC-2 type transport system permease protein|nr:ABC transporter permease [Candidatus Methanoplasma sp.]
MNHLLNIVRKELKELMTIGSFVSVLIMMFVFMGAGSMMGDQGESITSPSDIGFINGDGGLWADRTEEFLISIYVDTYGISEEEARGFVKVMDIPLDDGAAIVEGMRSLGLDAAIAVGPGYSSNLDNGIRAVISEYYIFTNPGLLGSAGSSITSLMIGEISDRISQALVSEIADPDLTPFLLSPIKGTDAHTYIDGELHSGVRPLDISMGVMNQTLMVPVVIMMVIMMIGSIVISSMGNEKENKTLETLLTMPVGRTVIVTGKILSAAIMGLVYGIMYMVGMMFYSKGMTDIGGLGGSSPADLGLALGPVDWLIVGTMVFLAIFCALGLCMILGAFAKNYKAAQTMTVPISVLAIIPMLLNMFASWGSLPTAIQIPLFIIPFTHPMMVMQNLMFGNTAVVLAGMAYLALFAMLTIFITVKVYKSDILLTGIGQTKLAKAFAGKRIR